MGLSVEYQNKESTVQVLNASVDMWTDRRSFRVYPVGFGIRFTRTMPLLQKEKSKPNTIAEDKVNW